ncbi:hypothetical protein E2P65_02095 [Candidatus Bathyarchaeota archaeon]|nr:hypothetical protein E2P65_02095 [Candidatus Bathyarchaeota archaeon]
MTKEESVDQNAEEAHAYTPGLKVKRRIIVEKTRRLPIQGEVLIERGAKADFETIVAKTEIPGDPMIIRADDLMGLPASDVPTFLVKKIGDEVEEDEVIARYSAFWGLMKKELRAPEKGTIESYSDTTGHMILRSAPIPVVVNAYIQGQVDAIIPKEGVVIKTEAAYLQGIFGIGGERHGVLHMVVDSPDETLTEDKITPEQKGMILVGGNLATYEALMRAIEYGVKGIVVGGIKGRDISKLLGYEIGVAITGEESIDLTLVVTEGFGEMTMSHRTFNLLKECEGKQAAINGTTQIRAGVLRPEVIIPYDQRESGSFTDEPELSGGMRPGTPVRIIADPYFGGIGTVTNLPVQLQVVETGSKVRVVDVMLDGGEEVTVPRANVEIIEE